MKLYPNDKHTYPTSPGVYQMLDIDSNIIYIGKAKNLQKRLGQYFENKNLSLRIQKMVKQIDSIEIITTLTEDDALILEQKLIHNVKPKYNIIFRDDKSYPAIFISKDKYPKLFIRREKHYNLKKDNVFGPFPNYEVAKNTIHNIQKIFKIRTCSNSEFSNRSRPCLLFSVNKCSAPCMADKRYNYEEQVDNAIRYLKGDVGEVRTILENNMGIASEKMEFEAAAVIRDQLNSLKNNDIQGVLSLKTSEALVFNYIKNKDNFVIGHAVIANNTLQKIRHENYKPHIDENLDDMITRYIEETIKIEGIKKIITPHKLENLFYPQVYQPQTVEASWQKLLIKNLELVINEIENKNTNLNNEIASVKELFNIDNPIIDAIDITHFNGEATYAGLIRYSNSQYDKVNFRLKKFEDFNSTKTNINDAKHIHDAVMSLFKNRDLPDILIIDGGVAQINSAKAALDTLNIDTKKMILLSSEKGVTREMGAERILSIIRYNEHFLPVKIDNKTTNEKENNIYVLTIKKSHQFQKLTRKLQDRAHDFSNYSRENKMSNNRFGKK